MRWLVASAVRTDVAALRDGEPALWRELRRYNAPVQLALAAAAAVTARAKRPTDAALISLAPCEAGSPELHRWVRDIDARTPGVRMNPTHTLHAVDNLALSVLSMRLGARGWALGLGGAPGQLWAALEAALDRPELEAIVVAGDQRGDTAAGVALLLAREPLRDGDGGAPAPRLVAVERVRRPAACEPHAADGARAMLEVLAGAPAGRTAYRVPAAHGDGIDEITAIWEVG